MLCSLNHCDTVDYVDLPSLYWIAKFHNYLYNKRYITGSTISLYQLFFQEEDITFRGTGYYVISYFRHYVDASSTIQKLYYLKKLQTIERKERPRCIT